MTCGRMYNRGFSFTSFFLATIMQHAGSQFPDQGSNPCSLHWENRVLTTGPPGKSLVSLLTWVIVIQLLSRVCLFVTPWTAAYQAFLSFTISKSLLECMSFESSDAIQPSHPLLSPSLTFSLSQHQGLFQWVSSSYQVAKAMEFQLQHQSFQWIFRTDFLYDWLVWSPCSPR